MSGSRFAPEIRASMGRQQASPRLGAGLGRPRPMQQGAPQVPPVQQAAGPTPAQPAGGPPTPLPQGAPVGSGAPPDAHKILAATSIAHAILGSRSPSGSKGPK